jgi:2-oxo-4-hydroxy-4-carboxy-5-ureidoimidazoline decarboxylase
MMSLAEVNAMDRQAFVARFSDVAEHAPWVAERSATRRPFANREVMIAAFQSAIRDASRAEQLSLFRSHPDLAGRAAMAGEVAAESLKEQAAAGLDRLTPVEFDRLTEINRRYRHRFAIPFIFAVKGATKHQIFQSFAERLGNDPDTEHATALDHVCRIVGLRIAGRVAEQS